MATFEPIGTVSSQVIARTDIGWGAVRSKIILRDDLKAGLLGLSDFSHAQIVYHLHQAQFDAARHTTRRPQGREDMPHVGIFAQRAKDRPNAIGVTAVRICSVEDGVLTVEGLDAIDGTPVLDIKPYYPQYDMRPDAAVPEWVDRLMTEYF